MCITEKEVIRRRNKLIDFEEKFKILQYQSITLYTDNKGIHENDDLEENLLGDDGEYQNTRGKKNKEVLEIQRKMLRDQDDKLDQIIGIGHNIGEDAKAIGRELDEQNNMLDNLEKGFDKTNVKMFKTNSKLTKLIAESSQWWLWITILLLSGALVSLIILL